MPKKSNGKSSKNSSVEEYYLYSSTIFAAIFNSSSKNTDYSYKYD